MTFVFKIYAQSHLLWMNLWFDNNDMKTLTVVDEFFPSYVGKIVRGGFGRWVVLSEPEEWTE